MPGRPRIFARHALSSLLAAPLLLAATSAGAAQLQTQEPAGTAVPHIPLTAGEGTLDPGLRALAHLIGDARVVQLGEFGHGLGDSYDERIRITRFLHEEMGFDLLLFESPMALSMRMNRELAGAAPLAEVVDRSILPAWSHSAQMTELFEWIRSTKAGPRPVDLYAVDSQLMGHPGETEAIVSEFESLLEHDPDPVAGRLVERLRTLVDDLQLGSGVAHDGAWFARTRTALTDVEFLLRSPAPEVRASTSERERLWGLQVLATLGYMVEDRAVRAFAPPFTGDFAAYGRHSAVHHGQNRRDQAMASNIEWIVNTLHPGRKAVVWLANSHAYETARAELEAMDGLHPGRQHTTGSYLVGMMGEEVFTLLASTWEGERAGSFVWTEENGYEWIESPIEPAPESTLEARLHAEGVARAIVDLQGPAGALGLGLRWDPDHTRLSELGDALLFLDVDGPSLPRPGAPIGRGGG